MNQMTAEEKMIVDYFNSLEPVLKDSMLNLIYTIKRTTKGNPKYGLQVLTELEKFDNRILLNKRRCPNGKSFLENNKDEENPNGEKKEDAGGEI